MEERKNINKLDVRLENASLLQIAVSSKNADRFQFPICYMYTLHAILAAER